MFFFIAGTTEKKVGEKIVQVKKDGVMVGARVQVFKTFLTFFFIPLFSINLRYRMYIPATDEYYESGRGGNMPEEYIEICKEVAR